MLTWLSALFSSVARVKNEVARRRIIGHRRMHDLSYDTYIAQHLSLSSAIMDCDQTDPDPFGGAHGSGLVLQLAQQGKA